MYTYIHIYIYIYIYIYTHIIIYRPGHTFSGKVHVKQIYEIAKLKQMDPSMAGLTLEAICRCIAGSAASMGLEGVCLYGYIHLCIWICMYVYI
jgi:hypothetical protein